MSGIIGAVVVAALVGLGQNPPACPLGEGWVFAPEVSDEFNDPSLDAKKWWDFNPEWHGRKPAYFARENVAVKDGLLQLTARVQKPEEVTVENKVRGYDKFTTATVKSKKRIQYGYFEARCRSMKAGVCNAFWLYDPLNPPAKYREGSFSEEIDIFEIFGKPTKPEYDRVYCTTVHRFYTPYVESIANFKQTPLPKKAAKQKLPFDFHADFHVYGFLWTPTEMKWFVDGREVFARDNDYYHTALYIMFDCEIMQDWVGLPDPADLPSTFSIDYLRVWQSFGETLPTGVRRISPSELRIECEMILPGMLDRPIPQGPVDVNPPWLHVQVPMPPGKQAARAQQWKRRFYFKLSQDPELKRETIVSGPKRWSFFNPYRTLAKGTWYWTYGVAAAESPDKPVWQPNVFSFTVDDLAFAPAIPPTPEQALAAIRKHQSGPVAICTSEDVGHLLPDATWPELAAQMRQDADKALRDGERPVSIELTERDVPARLGKKPKESFFMVKLRSLFTAEERRVDSLLRGYLLTGDERFKKLGVQRAIELENERRSRIFDTPAGEIPLTRPAFYNTVPLLVLDAFWDDLPETQRQTFVALALSLMDKRGQGFPHLHDQLEHAHFNQHDWQGDIKNLLVGATILSRRRADMDDWFAYAYELWLYRSPALSRADGGSMDGNGYLGVHEEPLTHLNWMLMHHTGYNFFRAKRWFINFPSYMSYMNPVGNPGVPFSDGGDDSPGVCYLTEMLAYTCPENPANLWRYKTQGRRSVEEFSKDIVKGYKAMSLLQMWRQLPAPDLSHAQPPAESAAAFRDVGLAGMHSNILDADRNVAVSFNSAVNGSFQHLHPAQNAFCIGYGGEPLFWRSGYYNGGQIHDALSYKASRAHNTLLVDGLMQGFDLGAYGWIPRFVAGRRISYVLGDASHAYNGMFPKYGLTEPDQPLPSGLKVLGVPVTRENGFGKPAVTRFRRHLVMLRPSHVLIYDELEAEKPVTWTFQLHSLKPMQQQGNAWFTTANGKGTGSARLFCSTPVVGSLTDQFFAAAVDEEDKRGGQNPPHWHAAIATREKLTATRFLTVIEVQPGAVMLTEPIASGVGKVKLQVRDYTIAAELDASRSSLLEVRDRENSCALVTGQAADSISLGDGCRRASFKGSTLLWENEPGKLDMFREEIDQLPRVLLFGNRY